MSEVTLESQLIEIIKDEDMAEHIKLAKVDMLIKLGVDVNALYGAKSALKLANEVNEPKIAKMLEDNKARDFIDEEKANELGVKLCEIYESEAENINIAEIKELIDMGADVDVKDNKGWTALINASRYGHKEIAEVLIKSGADVNAAIEYSNGTALMEASYSGHKEIVELLIKNGADVNQKDSDGCTALMEASYEENKEIVELLIQNGADVNQKNNHGVTALMRASMKMYTDVTEVLIQNGAHVNQKDEDGWTALIWASNYGYKEVVELLILSGSDVNQKDNNGQNAMMRANEETRKAIMEAVKKRNEKTGENVIVQGIERE